jgi:RimJ/RimL family protein N-acetyltransferase
MALAEYAELAELRDGTRVEVRAVRPTDKVALQLGFSRLSPESVYNRFFQSKRELSAEELRYLTEVDFDRHIALVVTLQDDPAYPEHPIIGVARFVRLADDGSRAEVAFTVGDPYQGRGMATLLLHHLVVLGRRLGVRHFEAEVLPDNRQMLEVFQHGGLPWRETAREGVVHVELQLDGAATTPEG